MQKYNQGACELFKSRITLPDFWGLFQFFFFCILAFFTEMHAIQKLFFSLNMFHVCLVGWEDKKVYDKDDNQYVTRCNVPYKHP